MSVTSGVKKALVVEETNALSSTLEAQKDRAEEGRIKPRETEGETAVLVVVNLPLDHSLADLLLANLQKDSERSHTGEKGSHTQKEPQEKGKLPTGRRMRNSADSLRPAAVQKEKNVVTGTVPSARGLSLKEKAVNTG